MFFFKTLFMNNHEKITYAMENNFYKEVKNLILKENGYFDLDYYFEVGTYKKSTESLFELIDLSPPCYETFRYFLAITLKEKKIDLIVVEKLLNNKKYKQRILEEEPELFRRIKNDLNIKKLQKNISNFE